LRDNSADLGQARDRAGRPILRDASLRDAPQDEAEQVFEVLRELVAQRRKTVVAVTHDLAMASRMDREIVLMDGAIDKVVDAQR
jgi:lipoprotein-releasing system ATP-binding protein